VGAGEILRHVDDRAVSKGADNDKDRDLNRDPAKATRGMRQVLLRHGGV
jgi:hypothetical protein